VREYIMELYTSKEGYLISNLKPILLHKWKYFLKK